MSVLIRGMDMPSIDLEWRIIRGQDGKWYAIDVNAETSDGEWHEIVPVPPHGRLIDADALLDSAFRLLNEESFLAFQQIVFDAPTIIPAEPCNNLSKPCKEDKP